MRRAEVVALGLLQGPAELLPVSSSAHLAALPWLLGWEHARLDSERRKEVEVALHAGAAFALLIGLRRELLTQRPQLLVLSLAPPAAVGLAGERFIERRLGGPRSLVAGLLAGSAALVLADRAPQARAAADAGWRDGLALGAAQACALVPGVSRCAASLAAARALGFRRPEAARLARTVGVPVLVGAAALKGLRLARRRPSAGESATLALGAAAACGATFASLPLARLLERDRPLAPWAAYRGALAFVLLAARRGVRENPGR
jgi:undecaprenyl-diphosphatase